jgi:tRNA uracil 4-sulfurtransferase
MQTTSNAQQPGLESLFLLRLSGELAIKSRRTRSGFQRRLLANLRDALASTGVPAEASDEWTRIFVRTAAPDAVGLLGRVFGLSSISRVDAVVPAELDIICRRGGELYAERVRGRSYAVRARRAGSHGFRSRDIEVELGAVLNAFGTVDLSHPDVTISVEVRDRDAYLLAGREAGAGGLPLGTEGRALALISGGYDSAVAAWLMLKRGVQLDYVFCNLGGDAYERAVVQVAKVLADDWSYGYGPRLHVVPFGGPVDALRSTVKPRYWQVVLKRLMYRAASAIGRETGSAVIVTGEAIGQVSSQTLSNLAAIDPAASLPVFRPLLGFDKEEIIDRARRIGTAALSERVKEYCAIAPGHPVTAAAPEAASREEAAMDLTVLDGAVAARRTLEPRRLSPADVIAPYLFTRTVPDGAVIIDVRPSAAFSAWHYPGAIHMDEWELQQGFRRLDRDHTYVLYCAHGAHSAYLAERMQRAGYEAYSFAGGLRGVVDLARERGIATGVLI